MKPSKTAYDDSFPTLLSDCKELIISVVNEVFGKHYKGQEEVIFSPNEFFLNKGGGTKEKRITDSSFIIVSADGAKQRYHIKCEANLDDTNIPRILKGIFDYNVQASVHDAKQEATHLTAPFPSSAVITLRHTENTPNALHIRLVTSNDEIEYDVPVIKVQQYSLEEIFRRRLLLFLPFYIFSHERQLPEYESDKSQLNTIVDEYRLIRTKLDELQEAGDINVFMKNAICAMITHVLASIAENYQKVREGLEHTMRGKS